MFTVQYFFTGMYCTFTECIHVIGFVNIGFGNWLVTYPDQEKDTIHPVTFPKLDQFGICVTIIWLKWKSELSTYGIYGTYMGSRGRCALFGFNQPQLHHLDSWSSNGQILLWQISATRDLKKSITHTLEHYHFLIWKNQTHRQWRKKAT